MWHVVCLQHLARACSEQSRSTTVLPINHVIQMPQCLSGFVNRDYSHESRSVASDGLTKCIQAMVSLNIYKNSANKFGRKIPQFKSHLTLKV